MSDFEAFWKLYPRHDHKYRAEKAWNRLSGKDKETALRILPTYYFPPDPQFIPMASTFLNGKYFLDEQPIRRKDRRSQSLGYAEWEPSEADREFRRKNGLPEIK